MTQAGPKNPGTVTQFGGAIIWTGIDNIKVSDDTRAISSLTLDDLSRDIIPQNFGFAIPESDIIDGIQVDVELSASAADVIIDGGLILSKTVPAPTGDFKKRDQGTFWPSPDDATVIYGDSTDLWGGSWTPAEINAVTFGVMIFAVQEITGLTDARIDHVQVTVFHHSRHLRNRVARGVRRPRLRVLPV